MYRSSSSSCSVNVLAAACVLLATACGGSQAPATTPEPAPAEAPPAPAPASSAASELAPAAEAPPAPAEHRARHHHFGLAAMFIASLESVELKPEQKTAVEGIESDLAKLGEQHKEIGSKLANDVADGAEAGKIDHKKTDADIKEIVKAIEGTVPATQDAMTRLYKTLDAAQRKQLVETMRAKAKEMGEHGMGEHGMDEHHGEHGKGEHGDHGKGEHGDHGKGEHAAGEHHGDHGPMHELGELELTAEQREKIHTKIEAEMKAQEASKKQQMEATKKHMDAIGDAFASDKFDAKKLGVGKQAPEMAKKMATMRVKMAEIVTGVLTPEQRTKFAAHIREHAGDPD